RVKQYSNDIVTHYQSSYHLDPHAEDATVIRERACGLLADAARRSASLGASTEAQAYYEQAAGLAVGPLVQAEFLEQAGRMAWRGAHGGEARGLFLRAIELLEVEGDPRAATRVSARLGEVDVGENRHTEAIERMERAFAVLSAERDESLAALAETLARAHNLRGSTEDAAARVEVALEVAES